MSLGERQLLAKMDPENMLGHIENLPDQLWQAWKLGHELELPRMELIRQVVVAGMGGSAIGGDLLANYLVSRCDLPIISHRDYDLPAWAKGAETLVICSSHSGNTEETLSAFDAALANGCSILTLSTGGKLTEKAQVASVSAWTFEHVGQPRTAIGYSFGMLLALMTRLGLVSETDGDVLEAVGAMKDAQTILGADVEVAANPAKRLAGQLVGRYVSIFAAGQLEVVARRWKTQINELAKAWAQFEGLPEADHNTLAGTLNPEALLSKVAAIFLRAEMDHPRNSLRLDATRQLFMLEGLTTDEVWARGERELAQMWTLLHFGDYVAYYLALMYQVDPTPVAALVALKQKLADK